MSDEALAELHRTDTVVSGAVPQFHGGLPLSIDLAAHTVTVDGTEAKLTRKEFEVLALLARHAGRLVTHKQLLTTVWGPAHLEDSHYLRIAVGHIRDNIGDDAADPKFIVTEPGVGYRLLG